MNSGPQSDIGAPARPEFEIEPTDAVTIGDVERPLSLVERIIYNESVQRFAVLLVLIAVWELYAHTVRRLGSVSTLVEWDAEIPPLVRLCEEVDRARGVADAAMSVSGGGRIAKPS